MRIMGRPMLMARPVYLDRLGIGAPLDSDIFSEIEGENVPKPPVFRNTPCRFARAGSRHGRMMLGMYSRRSRIDLQIAL